jgi:hypothetical protein
VEAGLLVQPAATSPAAASRRANFLIMLTSLR